MTRILATLFALLFAHTAHANACREEFIRLLNSGNAGPVKSHVTQAIKGGATTANYHYHVNQGHWMTEMISPANLQWTLVHNNVMYTSSDKGKSWKKVRTLDAVASAAATAKDQAARAKTVKNATCSEEELDGTAHKTVGADYATPKYKMQHHQKYWVNPATGWIAKSVTTTRTPNFESVTTQLMQPAPTLKLPTPK